MTTITILDLEFDVIVDSITPYDVGRSSGPPEDCYPPEGGEVEWHIDEDHPIAEFIQTAIDNNESWKNLVEDTIWEKVTDEPEPPEPWDD